MTKINSNLNPQTVHSAGKALKMSKTSNSAPVNLLNDTVAFTGKKPTGKSFSFKIERFMAAVITAIAAAIAFVASKFTTSDSKATSNFSKQECSAQPDGSSDIKEEPKGKTEVVSDEIKTLPPEAEEMHERAKEFIKIAQEKIDDSIAKYQNAGMNSDGEVTAVIKDKTMTEKISDDTGSYTRRSFFNDNGSLDYIEEIYTDGKANIIGVKDGKLTSYIEGDEVQRSGLHKKAKKIELSYWRDDVSFAYSEDIAIQPDGKQITKKHIYVSGDKKIKYAENVKQ